MKYTYNKDKEDGTIIRYNKEKPIQRFDKEAKEWVEDWSLLDIFIGSRMLKAMSKEEVDKETDGKAEDDKYIEQEEKEE